MLVVSEWPQLVSAELINGAVFRYRHQPRAWTIRDASHWPTLQRRNERLLREVLGEANVTNKANETTDQPRGLDAPDRLDRLARGGLRHCLTAARRSRAVGLLERRDVELDHLQERVGDPL